MPAGGRGLGMYLGGFAWVFPPSGPAVTNPWPNPCGSDKTPNALSSLSGGFASFIPPPTRTHVPRRSGVPSGNRLIVAARCETLSTGGGCAFDPPARPWRPCAPSDTVNNTPAAAAIAALTMTCFLTVRPLSEIQQPESQDSSGQAPEGPAK